MESQGEKTLMKPRLGRRLLLFPVPLQGHINPMLQLASILHSRGFSITILHTHFNSPNQFNYLDFTFQPIPDDMIETETSSAGILNVLERIKALNQYCADPLHDCLARLLSDSIAAKEPVACLISDSLWYFTQSISDSLNLPRIVLRPSSLACALVYNALPLLREKGYFSPSTQDSQSEAPLPEFQVLKVKDVPQIVTDNWETPCEIIANMIKQTKKASGIIWNSFQELEEPELATILQEIHIRNFLIGPFHKYFPASSSSLIADDRSAISWLDMQTPNSVLYVSFGSIARMDKTKFTEVACGLAQSNQAFLWVVRPGLLCGGSEWLEHLPNGFLEAVEGRGHIVKWAPQKEVLAHPATGGFWTHNGWNSTMETICEGVPMICSPSFGDQPINARYVCDVWKVGLELEKGLEREEIESTIKKLMVGKEGEEVRERIIQLKEMADLVLSKVVLHLIPWRTWSITSYRFNILYTSSLIKL